MRNRCDRLIWAAIVSALLVSGAGAEERIWTDKSGKFQVSAEMVDVIDGKVRLKRPDGRVVSVPVERLSDADQQFIEQAGGGGDAPWKVGDKVYIQTKGQWQLGVLTEINDGLGSARFEVSLRTGSKRRLRATEQRLRRYGKAGDHGLLLPGDVVEIDDHWNKGKTGVVVSVSGSRAKVRVEGELGEKSVWLSSLKAPGAGDTEGASLAGRVASAADRNRKPGQKAHPGDKLTYPAPELTDANFTAAKQVDLQAGSAPGSLRLALRPRDVPVSSMRPFPVKLIPKQDGWDKFGEASVAADGSLGAVLRTTRAGQVQIELVPTYKTRAKSRLFGLPPKTKRVEVAPDGRFVMTIRSESFEKQPKIDVWRVEWESDERKAVAEFEHQVSWSPDPTNDSWYKLTGVRWLTPETLLTLDSKRVVVWDAATGQPRRTLPASEHATFVPGADMLAINRGEEGVVFLDLQTMRVAAVVGAGEALFGKPSISPSGARMMIVGKRGLEFWDLQRGKKLLQTMLVSAGAGKPAPIDNWSLEEAYVQGGGHDIDVRTWTRRVGDRLPERSFAGVEWSIAEPSNKPPLLGGTQTLAPIGDAAVEPKTTGPFLLEPGDAVAVDVRVESEIADATRSRLTEMIESQGFAVGGGGRLTLRASTSVSTESQEYTKNAFGQSGDKGNFSVSYKVRQYKIAVLLDGKELWATSAGQSAGLPSLFTNEKEVRRAAGARLVPSAQHFEPVTLPEHILAVDLGG